jgi:Holliday junction resolvasome RuvABC endonuclease subunit
MTAPHVIGLDLSLRATGVALPDRTSTIRAKGSGMERLRFIRDHVVDLTADADLVVIEGYAYAARQQAHQIGELGGVVRYALWTNHIAYMDVPPSTLKKFATGNGSANKYAVLAAAVRRLGYDGTDDNEADAIWLREIGRQLLPHPAAIAMPKAQTAALERLQLPEEVMAA